MARPNEVEIKVTADLNDMTAGLESVGRIATQQLGKAGKTLESIGSGLQSKFIQPLAESAQVMKEAGFTAGQTSKALGAIARHVQVTGSSAKSLDNLTYGLRGIRQGGDQAVTGLHLLKTEGINVGQILGKQLGTDSKTALELLRTGALKGADAVNAIARGMDEASLSAAKLKIPKSFSDRLEEASKGSLGKLGSSLQQFGGNLSGIGQTLTMGLTLPIVGIGAAALSSAGNFEQTKVAFSTMLGSADKAGALLTQLQQFAASTPFELPQIQDSARKLLAFGVAADQIPASLRRIGDIAAGTGTPINELAEIYGKAKTQGRLFAEDINQLTGRGIPIIKELAAQFGVTENEVKGLVENGSVGFANLEAAFGSMTGKGSQFGGMMAAQSQTLVGQWSNLKDQLTATLVQLGTALLPVAKGVLEAVGPFLEWIKGLATGFAELSPGTQGFILTLVGIVAAIGPVLMGLGSFISALGSIIGFGALLPALSAGFATFWAAVTGPIGLVVAAIVGVIALGALLIANWDAVKQAGLQTWSAIKQGLMMAVQGMLQALATLFGWVPKLGAKLKAAVKSMSAQVSAERDNRGERSEQFAKDQRAKKSKKIASAPAVADAPLPAFKAEVAPSKASTKKAKAEAPKLTAQQELDQSLERADLRSGLTGTRADYLKDKEAALKKAMNRMLAEGGDQSVMAGIGSELDAINAEQAQMKPKKSGASSAAAGMLIPGVKAIGGSLAANISAPSTGGINLNPMASVSGARVNPTTGAGEAVRIIVSMADGLKGQVANIANQAVSVRIEREVRGALVGA